MADGAGAWLNLHMTSGASFHRKKFTADATAVIYLNVNTLGVSLENFPAILLQSDATFTVKVRLAEDAAWAAFPGGGKTSAAGEPVLIRGRWHELKVEIADTKILWFHGDQVPLAWG